MMSAKRNFTNQDYELLSAYLDGALVEAERAALETRLQADDGLRQELAVLQQTVNLVRGLPPLKAPRNFTLTPSIVRPRSARWLIFPTSAAFSAISAAAATLLILLGAGILLLQSNSVGAPTSAAHFVAEEQQSTAQIAALPTEIPPVSEKTAERDQRNAEETAAALNSVNVPVSPPTVANGATLPEANAASAVEAPQVTNQEQPTSGTSDGSGYTTQSGSTQGGEAGQSQLAAPAAPADSTLLYAATMAPPSVQPIAPGAADTAAQSDGIPQQETNSQSNTPAEITLDQIESTVAGGQIGTDTFGLLTATMPIVEQFAAISPTGTPTPNSTLTPTVTATASPTAAPTLTPFPTQIPPAPSVPGVPVDLFTWGVLIIGVLLLVVAIITTVIRRRS